MKLVRQITQLEKKAMLLDVNSDYGHILAIDLSKHSFKITLSNLKGEWLSYFKDELVEGYDVIEAIASFLKRSKVKKKLVKQVVIAYPGVVGHNNKYYLTNVKMQEQWLKEILDYIDNSAGLHVENETVVKNDVNLATLAEKQYGTLGSEKNMYYISGDTGVGSGVILNHKLYEGDRNAAGEIGFILPSTKVEGKYHTLEERICTVALTTRYSEKTGQSITLASFKDKIEQEDVIALKLYDEVISTMSMAITNVSSILDIKNVVVTGRLFELCDDTIEKIGERVGEMTPLETKISKSTIEEATLKGGAVHVGVKALIHRMI